MASALAVAATTHPGSHFPASRQGRWLWTSPLLGSARTEEAVALGLYWAGLAALGIAWLWLVRRVSRTSRLGIGAVVGVFVLWSTPFLAGPPTASDDVFLYYGIGQLVERGLDPYEVGISELGRLPAPRAASPFWKDDPSPYGPAFARLAWGVSSATGGDVQVGIIAFRLVNLASLGVLAATLVAMARRSGRRGPPVLVAALCNPLVLVQLVGGAHNDALMLAALGAGVALGLRGLASTGPRRHRLVVLGIALCGLASAVKVPGLLGAGILGWLWPGRDAALWRRLPAAAVAGGLGVATLVAVSIGSGLGLGWVSVLDLPSRAVTWLAPAVAVTIAANHLLVRSGIDLPQPLAPFRAAFLYGGLLLAASYVMRSHRIGASRALGCALLVVALSAPSLHGWYLTWAIVFLAVDGLSLPIRLAVVVAPFTAYPLGPGMLENNVYPWASHGYVALVVVVLIAGGTRALLLGGDSLLGRLRARHPTGHGAVPADLVRVGDRAPLEAA